MNRMHWKHGAFLVTALAAGALLTGCSGEGKALRHIERANLYYESGKYEEAEIEYKNALRLSQTNAIALSRLGLIYHEQGRWLPSILFLQRAKEFNAAEPEVRLRLGFAYYSGRRFKEAREEALVVLGLKPGHEEALLLLADSAVGISEMTNVLATLQSMRSQAETKAGFHIAQGTLYFRQQKIAEAEAAFKKALLLDPKSSAAHTALGNYYWHRDSRKEAERFLQAGADLAPPRSVRRIRYAEFLIRSGNIQAAKEFLDRTTKETPDYLPAWEKLAELAFEEKNLSQCEVMLGKILAKDPSSFDALLLRARLRLVQNEATKALDELKRMNDAFPNVPQVQFHLALAQLLNNDVVGAQASVSQAITRDPNFTEAVLLKAEMDLRRNDPASVIAALTPLVKLRPGHTQAQLLLASALSLRHQFDEALAIYDLLGRADPKNPQLPYLVGMIRLQQSKRPEAKSSFNNALALTPDYLPAVEQLILLDIEEKDYGTALQRVEQLLATHPNNALLALLQARVYFAQSDFANAESAATKALESAPNLRPALLLLNRILIAAKKLPQALERLQAAIQKNPKDTAALFQMGMIYDSMKNYPAARDAYEKALVIDPQYTLALNNLAYLYSERLVNLDRAFELAQTVNNLLPQDPYAADTFGWICLRRGDYPRALSLLKESAEKLPSEAEAVYHFAVAVYMSGDEAQARTRLQRCLELDPNLPAKEDASRRLALLQLDPNNLTAAALATLQQAVQTDPADPVAASRLAAHYEKTGAPAKAAEIYQQVLQRNTQVSLLIRFAQLQATALQAPDKALDLAKRARTLAPEDPQLAHLLGRLAYQSGDAKWSLSLLQESARHLPDQPEVLWDLAWTSYSLGQLTETKASLQKLLRLKLDPARLALTERFLGMIQLHDDPQKASAAQAQVQAILAEDSQFVPAQFVAALLLDSRNQFPEAKTAYQKILERPGYRSFVPAQRNLAVLMVEKLASFQDAEPLANAAREAYPADPRVAKILGIITYRRHEYSRAQQLLKEAVAKLPQDAEIHFHLGMAQYQLKDHKASAQALQQALALNSQAPFADEARQTLAKLQL